MTKEPVNQGVKSVECPVCKRVVSVVQQIDGFGRLIAKYRIGMHAGGKHSFGRTCKGSGELTERVLINR